MPQGEPSAWIPSLLTAKQKALAHRRHHRQRSRTLFHSRTRRRQLPFRRCPVRRFHPRWHSSTRGRGRRFIDRNKRSERRDEMVRSRPDLRDIDRATWRFARSFSRDRSCTRALAQTDGNASCSRALAGNEMHRVLPRSSVNKSRDTLHRHRRKHRTAREVTEGDGHRGQGHNVDTHRARQARPAHTHIGEIGTIDIVANRFAASTGSSLGVTTIARAAADFGDLFEQVAIDGSADAECEQSRPTKMRAHGLKQFTIIAEVAIRSKHPRRACVMDPRGHSKRGTPSF